jgi:hypothetical protein
MRGAGRKEKKRVRARLFTPIRMSTQGYLAKAKEMVSE